MPQARSNKDGSNKDEDILLKVTGLKKHFPIRKGLFKKEEGAVKAVDDVSFNVYQGETLGLVGESGCGKTTLGRCVVRAYQPTEGAILYYPEDGAGANGTIDFATLSQRSLRAYRHEVQMIFQDPYASLNPR